MSRHWVSHLALVLVVLGWSGTACATDVAVLLSAEVKQYRDAVEGFQDATKYRIVATHDMRADLARGRQLVRQIEQNDRPDLIYAVGIYALQAVVSAKPRTPVVFSMVMNPPSITRAGAVDVTGASMNVSTLQTLQLIRQLNPNIKKVGAIYDQNMTGFLIEKARSAAEQLGVELVAKKVQTPAEAIAALGQLQKQGVEALWMMPDRFVRSRAVLTQMILMSYRQKIPLVGLTRRHAEYGALISLSWESSKDIGRQAGGVAKDIIAGKAPKDVPFTTAREINIVVNLKAARKLGITVPKAVLAAADSVIK